MNESSEAEEVNGLIDSEEEREFFQNEADTTTIETPQTKLERTASSSENLNRTLKRRVKPGKRTKKPGRRIRTIVDSDDNEFEEGMKPTEPNEIAHDWYQTYTEDTLPNITFSFGVFWPFDKDNQKVTILSTCNIFLNTILCGN